MRQKTIDFLRDLSILCHKYDLYVEGENLKVEDGRRNVIVNNVDYDIEGQAYSTTFSELNKLD